MTRKIFALLLACLLILMSFTACGSKAPEADTTAAEVNAQKSAEERRRDELRSGIRIRRGEYCSEHAETDGR